MDLDALPQVAKPFPALALIFHTLHGAVVASLTFALALSAYYFNDIVEDPYKGAQYTLSLVGVVVVELGITVWLIARRLRIRKCVWEGQREIRRGRAGPAREAFLNLLRFTEYRLRPAATLYGLGLADILDGDKRGAELLFKRAGAYPPAMEARARIYLEDGMPKKAIRLLRLTLAIAPRRRQAQSLFEEALRQDGQAQKADEFAASCKRKVGGLGSPSEGERR